jgi:hypothetical protein
MSIKRKTADAARYLTEQRGHTTSKSTLEKVRARGPDDPRDHGPDFYRDAHGVCWYDEDALDRYAAQQLAALKFRGAAPQPANFRPRRADDKAA